MSEGSLAISMRGELWFKDGDVVDDATGIDDAASVFESPGCRVENFWRTMSEWLSPASLNVMPLANETWDRIEGEQTD